MRLGWKALLVAAAMVCAAAPALGYSSDGTFTVVDNAFRANDTEATSLTIAPGQTVTFRYPAGMTTHDVLFTGRTPYCTGLPPGPRPKGWSGDCTFSEEGVYPFRCEVHAEMTGKVVVAVPTPTPTPTPTADPGGSTTPAATPTPNASGTAPAPQSPPAGLKLKLASRQKGTRVRGSVDVSQAGSRLEVTVKSGKAKAGRWVKRSAAAGAVAFSVPLDARTRRALRAKHRLKLTVTVALTPPGAKTLTRSARATVSL